MTKKCNDEDLLVLRYKNYKIFKDVLWESYNQNQNVEGYMKSRYLQTNDFESGFHITWEKLISKLCTHVENDKPADCAEKIIKLLLELVKSYIGLEDVSYKALGLVNMLLYNKEYNDVCKRLNFKSNHVTKTLFTHSKTLISYMDDEVKQYYKSLLSYIFPIPIVESAKKKYEKVHAFQNTMKTSDKIDSPSSHINVAQQDFRLYINNLTKVPLKKMELDITPKPLIKSNFINLEQLENADKTMSFPIYNLFKLTENDEEKIITEYNHLEEQLKGDVTNIQENDNKPISFYGTEWLRRSLNDTVCDSKLDRVIQLVIAIIFTECGDEKSREHLMNIQLPYLEPNIQKEILKRRKEIIYSIASENTLVCLQGLNLNLSEIQVNQTDVIFCEDLKWYKNVLKSLPFDKCHYLSMDDTLTNIKSTTNEHDLTQLYDDLISMFGFDFNDVISSIIEHRRQEIETNNRNGVVYSESESEKDETESEVPNIEKFSFLYRNNDNQPSTSKSNENYKLELSYNREWLKNISLDLPLNGLVPTYDELSELILDMLKNNNDEHSLSEHLLNIFGFDAIETITAIVQHKNDVLTSISFENAGVKSKKIKIGPVDSSLQKPTISSQVVVHTAEEKRLKKMIRKEEKKLKSKSNYEEEAIEDLLPSALVEKRNQLEMAQTEPIFGYIVPHVPSEDHNNYPHVYKGKSLSINDPKMLPEGTERTEHSNYHKVMIPPNMDKPMEVKKENVLISSLDPLGKEIFTPLHSLNKIQSITFDTAYNTHQNMLVCAPTGTGKTNIALLTIAHCLKDRVSGTKLFDKDFKIIYIAPMKALASEMTANFSKKLKSIGVTVREYTGDMELSKAEIQETQMLVSTPEKWDVITRKPDSDIGLAYQVRLLIIDEVHLLNGDRGPVIESLVARTVRLVESSQQMIRIVGLSATLPNYVDVAEFLRVNPRQGLFFFDQRFRSVPLAQTFIGVKGKTYQQINSDMDEACFNEVYSAVKDGHQVMVFVHARNLTVTTAIKLREWATLKGILKIFEPTASAGLMNAKNVMERCNHRDVKELFRFGLSVHHAGMMRSDRNHVEKFFLNGFIKVLVCTATLAWGVNLPAHTVIIRGTDMMAKGIRQDLDILDVQQIFGRAGRPQFDNSGHGIIITPMNKLDHYLRQIMCQIPIESTYIKFLTDNLNAEIVLGTVNTIDEGVTWLSYTYLYIRMKKNPHEYGIDYRELQTDPDLLQKRKALIVCAAKQLDAARLIRFSQKSGTLSSTDYGRITSLYYLKYDTIQTFNEKMKDLMTESEVLYMIAHAQEFEQIKIREEEVEELDNLYDEYGHLVMKGASDTSQDKVCILLMTFLSRGHVFSSSLNTELFYISDNAPRLTRALFEIYLRRRNAIMAGRMLKLAQMFQQRQWSFETPLRQFGILTHETLHKIENQKLTVNKIKDMETKEVGSLIRNMREASVVKSLAEKLPVLDVEPTLTPITRRVLRICLKVTAAFEWDMRIHGNSQAFWYWIEDPDSNDIYHFEYFTLDKRKGLNKEQFSLFTTIPLNEPTPSQYYIRIISDYWLGSETYEVMTFANVVLPANLTTHTDLLDLEPLSVKALKNPKLESMYNFEFFNPIQTQMFHELYYTDNNILLGAPTGSGKTIVAEIAMFRLLYSEPHRKIVYVAPLKALVRERVEDWKLRFNRNLKIQVAEVTGDYMPDKRTIEHSSIIITTPEKWDVVSRNWETRAYVKAVGLMIFDEVHLLGEDRGPVLEAIVSRTNFIASRYSQSIRMMGLSTAIANAFDLGNWLDVPETGLFNFRPSVRPVPLEVHIQGFAGKHYCPRMATMNKPAYQALREHAFDSPALIFVSSRRQTRITASDLITFLVADSEPKRWLHLEDYIVEDLIRDEIQDETLKHTLLFGIGVHHAGLLESDRKIVEKLFLEHKIQVLVATSTLAWGVNFPAHLVIIKGTEYYDGKHKRYVDMPITDVLQMMGRAGRPQFDETGVAVVFVQDIKKDFYRKFLYEPFPVESHMLEVLPNHLNAEIAGKTVTTKQSACDYITWTYLYRRLVNNPSYYQLTSNEADDVTNYVKNLIESTLDILIESRCCTLGKNDELYATDAGKIGANYYLAYQTVRFFTDTLKPSISLNDILKCLSDAFEFNEMPVRHNEDKLNMSMAQHCKIKIIDPIDSPHTKTFILLQAHLSRQPMACADYNIDLKLVLDQCSRILQAMVDYCTAMHWVASAMRCVYIMQMLAQARWLDELVYTQLPHINFDDVYVFRELRDLLGADKEYDTITLPELLLNVINNAQNVYEIFQNSLTTHSENQIIEIMNCLAEMPFLTVSFQIANELGDSTDVSDDVRLSLIAGRVYRLTLNVKKHKTNWTIINANNRRKKRDIGWFIFLVDENSPDEYLNVRRCPDWGKNFRQQFNLVAPNTKGTYEYTLYLMCDGYIGLDQQFSFQFEVNE